MPCGIDDGSWGNPHSGNVEPVASITQSLVSGTVTLERVKLGRINKGTESLDAGIASRALCLDSWRLGGRRENGDEDCQQGDQSRTLEHKEWKC